MNAAGEAHVNAATDLLTGANSSGEVRFVSLLLTGGLRTEAMCSGPFGKFCTQSPTEN